MCNHGDNGSDKNTKDHDVEGNLETMTSSSSLSTIKKIGAQLSYVTCPRLYLHLATVWIKFQVFSFLKQCRCLLVECLTTKMSFKKPSLLSKHTGPVMAQLFSEWEKKIIQFIIHQAEIFQALEAESWIRQNNLFFFLMLHIIPSLGEGLL